MTTPITPGTRIEPASNPYAQATGQNCTELYLLQSEEDVRPVLHGPYESYEEAEAAGRAIYWDQRDDCGALFTLLIQWEERTVTLDTFCVDDHDRVAVRPFTKQGDLTKYYGVYIDDSMLFYTADATYAERRRTSIANHPNHELDMIKAKANGELETSR